MLRHATSSALIQKLKTSLYANTNPNTLIDIWTSSKSSWCTTACYLNYKIFTEACRNPKHIRCNCIKGCDDVMMLIPVPPHHARSSLLMQRRKELTNMGDNTAHALLELLHGHLFLLQPAEHLRAASLSSPLLLHCRALSLALSSPHTEHQAATPSWSNTSQAKSKQLILEEWILAEATVTKTAVWLVMLIIHHVHPHVNDVQDDFERLLGTSTMSQMLGNKITQELPAYRETVGSMHPRYKTWRNGFHGLELDY